MNLRESIVIASLNPKTKLCYSSGDQIMLITEGGDCAEFSGSSRPNDRRLEPRNESEARTPTKTPGHTAKTCVVYEIRASLTPVGFVWTSWSKPTSCRVVVPSQGGTRSRASPQRRRHPRSAKMNRKDYSLGLIQLL